MSDDKVQVLTPTAELPAVPHQMLFCCAIVKSKGPKVHWLHVTCHDYLRRLDTIETQLTTAKTLLEEQRKGGQAVYPADAVYRLVDMAIAIIQGQHK